MITRGYGVSGTGLGGTVFVDNIIAVIETDPSVVLEPDHVGILDDELTAEISDLVLLAPAVPSLNYLLHDEFTFDDAAPLPALWNAEPGPGTGNKLADADENCYKAGGVFVLDQVAGEGPPSYYWVPDSQFDHDAGNCMFADITNVGQTHSWVQFGSWYAIGSVGLPRFYETGYIAGQGGTVQLWEGFDKDVTSKVGLVFRSVGTFAIINGNLMWVDPVDPATPVNRALGIRSAYTSQSWSAKMDNAAIVDLPAEGYSEWDEDFSTVTDSKSAPASLTFWNINPSGTHTRATFTYETGKFMNIYFRHDGATAYSYVSFDSAGDLSLFDQTTPEWIEVGVLSDGISYQIDILDDGLNTRVFLDNIEMGSEAVCAAAQYEDQGRVLHNLVTNDIELSTHPYPALGIAADRVIAPQHAQVGTAKTDLVSVSRGVVLPISASNYVHLRNTERNVDSINTRFLTDGALRIESYSGGVKTSLITTGAGTVSTGDDVTLILEGTFCEAFVNNVSVGTSSAITHNDGNETYEFREVVGGGPMMDSHEFWPRDVSSLLPSELV